MKSHIYPFHLLGEKEDEMMSRGMYELVLDRRIQDEDEKRSRR